MHAQILTLYVKGMSMHDKTAKFQEMYCAAYPQGFYPSDQLSDRASS